VAGFQGLAGQGEQATNGQSWRKTEPIRTLI